MPDAAAPPALRAALSYLSAGWTPVVLHGMRPDGECTCGRGEACPPKTRGKHPMDKGWASSPRPSTADLYATLESHPHANIGIRTGAASGIFVLDVDTAGQQAMSELVAQHGGAWPDTICIQTGSGMWHFYFQLPPGETVTNSQGRIAPGVDVRGDGGQVVAPPSTTLMGPYRHHSGTQVLPAPEWLLGLMRQRATAPIEHAPAAAKYAEQTEEDARTQRNYLDGIRERLVAKRDKPWAEGDAWDITCLTEACHLNELVNSPWTTLLAEEALALYMEWAPHDATWDGREKCWRQARKQVVGQAKERPVQRVSIMQLATPSADGEAQEDDGGRPPLGEEVSAEDFMDRRDGLLAMRLLSWIEMQGPLATSPDGEIWAYRDGVWRPGEREVKRRIVSALGDRYRKGHSETMLDLIRSREPRITDQPQVHHVNFLNGMLNLATLELEPHNPEHMSTNQLRVHWNPQARCPQIQAWLNQILPEVSDQRVWAEIVGYSLYGDNPLHKAALLDGGGRNGKGTTLRIITAMLGRENIAAVAPQKLDSDRWAASSLFRALANIVGDVSPRSFAETEVFKQVTGGDMIQAERKYREPFRFVPRAFLIGSFNKLPSSADHSEGFFSRWVVLPFRAQIAEPDEHGNVPAGTIRKDPSVEERLMAPEELEGAAVVAVHALRTLLERGAFTESANTRRAREEFRQTADPLRAFLAQAVTVVPGVHIPRNSLYSAYRTWCGDNGVRPRGRNTFNNDLRSIHMDALGIPADEGRVNNVRVWLGLQLDAEFYGAVALPGGGS